MTKYHNDYGVKLEWYKKTHSLTYKELSKLIGIDPTTLNDYVLGKTKPTQKNKGRIDRFLRKQNGTSRLYDNNAKQKDEQRVQGVMKIFEAFDSLERSKRYMTNNEVLEVITTQQFGDKTFEVYGSLDNPLFIAVEVAEMIEVQNTTDLLKRVDDDEKLTYVISRSGQKRTMNMLTEFGVYEVLMQSRKPKAKEFKRVVKHVLREIRTKGYYMQGELVEPTQPTPVVEPDHDLAYIKAKLSDLQSLDNLSDIATGLEKVKRLTQIVRGLPQDYNRELPWD